MNYLIHENGRITQTGSCLDTAPESAFAHFDGTVLFNPPADVGFDTHYVHDGDVLSIPEKPGAYYEFDHAAGTWVLPASALASAKADKARVIYMACRSQILAGFNSDALGATHAYPSKETDQANLSASVLASVLPSPPPGWTTPFWCADASGQWLFRQHTVEQIQQVGKDGKTAILAAMGKNEQLQAQVASATTLEAVGEIAW